MNGSKSSRTDAGEMRQLISFSVGEEEYGLELLQVKEVIRMRKITWLPHAPRCVKGIFNLRGDVIPVMDLRERFGLPSIELTETTRVIVVEVAGRLVGLVVDSASQVVRLPADQFDPPPPVMGKGAGDLISGVGRMEDTLIILIKVDGLLSMEERSQIEESLESAAKEPVPVS